MNTRCVKPGEGRRVRVPAEGYAVMEPAARELPDDVWLRRRLAEADLVECDPDTGEPLPLDKAETSADETETQHA